LSVGDGHSGCKVLLFRPLVCLVGRQVNYFPHKSSHNSHNSTATNLPHAVGQGTISQSSLGGMPGMLEILTFIIHQNHLGWTYEAQRDGRYVYRRLVWKWWIRVDTPKWQF
jgi:hypothetical protein